MNNEASQRENSEEAHDQEVSLRRETDYHEEEVGHNVHQTEEDDSDTVQVENPKEDLLPIDFGGYSHFLYFYSYI